MIKVVEINKDFEGQKVLDQVSAQFESGKVNMIIGQSGSGKTVLLKSILGVHEVDSGSIFYDDRDFTAMDFKKRKKIRQEIGMVFQGGALFDSARIEENVSFPLDMFTNMTRKEKDIRVDECLDRVDLVGVRRKFPAELSGGMQKRVAIARAIVLNPRYLLCDEPNSGLDPKTALIIDKLIKEISYEYHITTIINSHDMNSVIEIADHIVYIHKGKKLWEGNSRELLKTDIEELNAFLFSSELMKKIRPV